MASPARAQIHGAFVQRRRRQCFAGALWLSAARFRPGTRVRVTYPELLDICRMEQRTVRCYRYLSIMTVLVVFLAVGAGLLMRALLRGLSYLETLGAIAL